MDANAIRERLTHAYIARLATVRPDGEPHIVPITFALQGDSLYFAVDAKPKVTTHLERLKNIAANPHVSVLVDHYENDWRRLWWVRIDGTARILTAEDETSQAIDLLVRRYPQYREARPAGPAVAIAIRRMTGWSAA